MKYDVTDPYGRIVRTFNRQELADKYCKNISVGFLKNEKKCHFLIIQASVFTTMVIKLKLDFRK